MCVNKTSFIFSQIILKVDGKLDAKDKTMPFKNIKPQNFTQYFKKWIIKIIFDMGY